MKAVSRDDVRAALDTLIQRQRLRVVRDSGKTEFQTIPSPWEALTASVGWKGASAGGGSFGSRPVISTNIVALCSEIESAALKAAEERGKDTPLLSVRELETEGEKQWARVRTTRAAAAALLKPKPGKDPAKQRLALAKARKQYFDAVRKWNENQRLVESRRLSLVPDSLRRITANLADDNDAAYWFEQFETWAAAIRSALAMDPVRARWAHGTRCPECGAERASSDRDGERVGTAALAVSWSMPDDDTHHSDDEWVVSSIECRACHTRWDRGEQLSELVDAVLRTNLERELVAE